MAADVNSAATLQARLVGLKVDCMVSSVGWGRRRSAALLNRRHDVAGPDIKRFTAGALRRNGTKWSGRGASFECSQRPVGSTRLSPSVRVGGRASELNLKVWP